MFTILGSIVNIIIGGHLYDHIMNIRTFTLTINKIFNELRKIMRKMATGTYWIC